MNHGTSKSVSGLSPDSLKTTQSTGENGNPPAGDSSFSQADWEPGRELLNAYIVESILGQGGMGEVFLVRRIRDGHRFAIKTLLSASQEDRETRRDFVRELRTWIDLPDHPNLTSCRFFRSIGDRLLIFAEYVSGGSLHRWISQGCINTVAQILDIAIQAGWGLHVAHECGVVHQDVKPANILMTEDGIAKITDFGLSRAKKRSGAADNLLQNEGISVFVSSAGMTPAYASPEQFEGRSLTRRSDIWSWGVTILEMFVGKANWRFGMMAPDVLKKCIEAPSDLMGPMHVEIARILNGCFEIDLASRWSDISKPVQRFIEAYQTIVGTPYPRTETKYLVNPAVQLMKHDRRTDIGHRWLDPDPLLKRAYQLAGLDLSEAEAFVPERDGSRNARVLADLEVYEEIDRIYSDLISKGWQELTLEYASILIQKSMINYALNDLNHSIEHIHHAIHLLENIPESDRDEVFFHKLAAYFNQYAIVLWKSNEAASAVAIYDRAIEIQNRFTMNHDAHEDRYNLSIFLLNKANALVTATRLTEAIDIYDRCIQIRNDLIQIFPGVYENDLAIACMNKAITLNLMARYVEALEWFNRSIAIREKLAAISGSDKLSSELAITYNNAAVTLLALYRSQEALEYSAKSESLYHTLVQTEGRTDFTNDLARTKINLALALSRMNRIQEALCKIDESIVLREELINQRGQENLRNDLAKAYYAKASIIFEINEYADATKYYKSAIIIWEALAFQENRQESLHNLPKAYYGISISLFFTGVLAQSLEYAARAVNLAFKLASDSHSGQLPYQYLLFQAWVGLLQLSRGDAAEAENAFQRLNDFIKNRVGSPIRTSAQPESAGGLLELARQSLDRVNTILIDDGISDLFDSIQFLKEALTTLSERCRPIPEDREDSPC